MPDRRREIKGSPRGRKNVDKKGNAEKNQERPVDNKSHHQRVKRIFREIDGGREGKRYVGGCWGK